MSENTADSELLSFASEFLQKQGALIEPQPDGLMALLPASLAQLLGLPEETRLGSDEAPLLYGSPLLERLIGLATEEVPVVYGQIEVPYLKKAGFDKLIGQDIRFTDGQIKVGTRADARTTYVVLICHYLAMSDERKEGLVQVAVHEGTGSVIENFEGLWSEARPAFFPHGKVPPHFPVHLEKAFSAAMNRARIQTEAELADFLSSMKRRLRRDISNTREYYEALRGEMEAGLSHPNLTETQRMERMGKIRELPDELARKIADIEQKYQVEVSVSARAAMRFLVDVAQVHLDLRYRKFSRTVRTIWNPVTRRLDPLVCDRCLETTRTICPTTEGSEIVLLCPSCNTGKR
jgi:hypothetical protein